MNYPFVFIAGMAMASGDWFVVFICGCAMLANYAWETSQ